MKTSTTGNRLAGTRRPALFALATTTIVGATAAAVFIYQTWIEDSDQTPRGQARLTAELEADRGLAADVARLRRDVSVLKLSKRADDLNKEESEEVEANRGTEGEVEDRPRTYEERQDADARKIERTTTAFEQYHREETIDVGWARERESAIREFVAGLASVSPERYEDPSMREALSEIDLVSCDCRSTLCRIEFDYGANSDAREALISMLGSPPFDGAAFFTESPDGNLRAYNARNGHQLPPVEQGT